ncbi:ABC transporter ATP-binding protein [Mycetocola lacteus]|uniref:ABC transporter ATP-binding protein n=1 Tax=Mycetocola lacteus TaxID=76637 RepID=A0A3L7APH3_9MICO|nr:ABC transporter ATP-binding protein [Mycetocola lacteus]RLP81332.1 ABC transporter ATP-binding protein [Mycetocola lacteus]
MIRAIGFQNAKVHYSLGMLLLMISSVATAMQPMFVGQITEAFAGQKPVVVTTVLFLLAVFVVDALGTAGSKLVMGIASERFVFNVRNSVARRILHTNHRSFQSFDKGDLNNRVVEDIPAIQRPYFTTYPELLGAAIVALLCFIGMVFTSWTLALVLIAVLTAFGALLLIVLRSIRTAAETSRVAESAYSSRLYELLYNFVPVKSLGAENWVLRALNRRAESSRVNGVRLVGVSSLILPIINMATQVSLVGVLLLGGVQIGNEDLTPAALATFFLYLVYMISPLVTLGLSLGELREAAASHARLQVIYETLPEDETQPQYRFSSGGPGATFRSHNLAYRYQGGERVAIPDISIEGPGIYCLVGSNGAGKSTLFLLMNGLHVPTEGSLSWNGKRIHEGLSSDLRRFVYLMPQSRDVLSTTVRDNILMGAVIEDAEIFALAFRLGVSNFLEGLPDGLDTQIGHEGVELSGGQKQLLYVFHALLLRPPVILLDEFASNLDRDSKAAISDALTELATESLIIVITHDKELLTRFPRHITLG